MRIRKWAFTVACVSAIIIAPGINAAMGAQLQKIIVFAAASTTNAMTEIAKRFEKLQPVQVRLSFASSSTLAKQIENGAPVDIFLSANPKWMDYLFAKGAIVPSSRSDLLGNRIVLIAPQDSSLENLSVDSAMNLTDLLGDGRMAMGDPDHVPAGMYGKKALEKLGLWNAVKGRLARAKDVRAALVLVERGETPLGQVYATDAAISNKVKIVGTFPEQSHPPIIYPVAMVNQSVYTKEFITFLKSETATEIFRKYGFSQR
jgi:molybdate transport system substrate-binding protein